MRPLTVVTVHPWATLGGSEYNCVGMAEMLAGKGIRTITFNLRASSMVWGVLVNHRAEVAQVSSICQWAADRFGGEIILFGSSAGAPMAGSVLPRLDVVTKFVAVGYTWGWFASVGFGRHFGSLLRCEKPKLFIMGEHDEFTSVTSLKAMVQKMRGQLNELVIEPGVGHFELEQPSYDGRVAELFLKWLGD